MIASHTVQTNHLITTDSGAELYIELDNATGQALITYRIDRNNDKITLPVNSFVDLTDLLNEAIKIIVPTAEG